VYELKTEMSPDCPFLSWVVQVTANSTSFPSGSSEIGSGASLKRRYVSDVLCRGGRGDHEWDVLHDPGVKVENES
jgi:hypothetical protein